MVTQAIIPLAGLGTRLLPLSSVIPKELLPINGKPNLEYIMDENITKERFFEKSTQKSMDFCSLTFQMVIIDFSDMCVSLLF